MPLLLLLLFLLLGDTKRERKKTREAPRPKMCSFELDKPTNEVAHELDMRRGDDLLLPRVSCLEYALCNDAMRCDVMRCYVHFVYSRCER